MKGKMTDIEFNAGLSRLGFDGLHDACIELKLKAGIPVDPDHIRTQLDRHGRLSRYQTTTFRLFFAMIEDQHECA